MPPGSSIELGYLGRYIPEKESMMPLMQGDHKGRPYDPIVDRPWSMVCSPAARNFMLS